MRTRTTIIILAAVLIAAATVLAGCGIAGNAVKGAVEKSTGVSVESSSGGVTVQGKEGSVTVGGAQGAVPDGFPTDFPQYSGATVKTGAKVAGPDGAVYTVVWTTTDPLVKVISTYKEALNSAGYTLKNEVEKSTPDASGAVIEVEKEGQRAIVTFSEKDGATQIAVVATVK